MSMSTHVIGFAPPDDEWKKMKAVWDACDNAGLPIPRKVEEFFGGDPPDDAGVEVKLMVEEWRDEGREGYEVNLDKVPKHVKRIRFYNTW